MSAYSGPEIPNDGLVFCYDMNNSQKSWKGAPTTNLIPYSQDYGSNGNFMLNWTGNLFNNWINSVVTTGIAAPDGSNTANLITGYYSRWTASIAATTNTVYTFSIWLKNNGLTNPVDLNVAFGLNGVLVNYNNITSVSVAGIANWTRYSVTVTSPSSGINQIQCGVDFGASKSASAGPYSVAAWGAQLETGSYATSYVPSLGAVSSRSSTQALLDLTNNNTITANSLTYLNDSTFSFNGSNNYINVSNGMNRLVGTNAVTFSAWIYRTSAPAYWAGIISNKVNVTDGICLLINPQSRIFWQYDGGTSGVYAISGGATLATNTWYNIVGVYDNVGLKTYLNGVLNESASDAGKSISSAGNMDITIGAQDTNPSSPFPGTISSVQIHNRALSAAEVEQNFNATRSRYGI
jgi:hypothetical protein